MDKNDVKAELFHLIEKHWKILFPENAFRPSSDYIQYSGAIFDSKEIIAAVDSLLDGWFGIYHKAREFEKKMARYIGVSDGVVVNSGSSANLLAVSALKSSKIENPLKEGDEIITAVSGFPTTINPIIQNQLIPVFLDIELGSYNIDISKIEGAVSPKTRAIFVVHTLGNPVDMKAVCDIADRYDLFVLEDCCDALDSRIYSKKVGSYGDLATFSFYPAHHITTGEGGLVTTSNYTLLRILRSLREWGRDCRCYGKKAVGLKNGVCGKRFSKWLDGLDVIVDHKYVYSEIGYNLKPLELQCAIGLEQLKKLETFVLSRAKNFTTFFNFFKNYEDYFILPSFHKEAKPSWFGFPLTIRQDSPFDRSEIVKYLEENRIQTRNLFAGNVLYQPAYKRIRYRSYGDFTNADIVIASTFFIGVYPGIDDVKIDYILNKLEIFLKSY
jgi:dTDP-4-amino-4,6-dideoxygalactose transaminase